LLFPDNYVGVPNIAVPLWVSNPGSNPVPVGAPGVSGPGAADVAIAGDTCPGQLNPGATCVITARVTPRASGLRQSLITVPSGGGSSTVTVTDRGIAGDAAFILDSEPGEGITQGQTLLFNQFDATISGVGTPNSVGLQALSGPHWFTASFAAPQGQSLAVGTYTNAGPAPGQPKLDISGDQRGCSDGTGTFTIRQIAFDDLGHLASLAADAVYRCGNRPQAIFATFRMQ
jgi:hypothetical protein